MRFIKAAGKIPVERNTLYETMRTFDTDDSIPVELDAASSGAQSPPDLVQLVGTGRA